MPKKKPAASKDKKPGIPAWEKAQVRARRKAGLDFALKTDEFGRERLAGEAVETEQIVQTKEGPKKAKAWVGTAESTREFEVTTGGKVRVRNVDPLKGITSLNHHQREAGKWYREIYEAAATIGIKSGSFNERVDGGGQAKDIPAQLLRTLQVYDAANDCMGHHEIAGIVKAICGDGMSVKEYAQRTRDNRDVVVRLLKIGLDKIAVKIGIMRPPKPAAAAKK